MASDLSPHLHSDECNVLITALHQCHAEYKFSRFLGKCNSADKAVTDCLRREVMDNKTKNRNRKLKLRESKKPEDEN